MKTPVNCFKKAISDKQAQMDAGMELPASEQVDQTC
jgi:hypothetical protein